MSSALNTSIALPRADFVPVRTALAKSLSNASERFDSFRFAQGLRSEQKPRSLKRKDYLIVGLLVVAVHFAGVAGYLNSLATPGAAKPKKNEVVVELVKPVVVPVIVPPQQIEPPKPIPPKLEPKPQPARPTPALRTAPAEQNIAADELVVPENTSAPKTTAPVAAVPTPPPAPPAPKEEPVTEASGYAGYLNNPPPEYPAFAQRQGWEGKVILRVHVQANGKASSVDVKQSSGRKTLDDAALEVVKTWTFAPAKRGTTPIDGWATVPIEFKLGN